MQAHKQPLVYLVLLAASVFGSTGAYAACEQTDLVPDLPVVSATSPNGKVRLLTTQCTERWDSTTYPVSVLDIGHTGARLTLSTHVKPDGTPVEPIFLDDRTVLVATGAAELAAVNVNDGTYKWRKFQNYPKKGGADAAPEIASLVLGDRNTLIVSSDGRVQARDTATGIEAWNARSSVDSRPARLQRSVFAGDELILWVTTADSSSTDELVAYDARTGKQTRRVILPKAGNQQSALTSNGAFAVRTTTPPLPSRPGETTAQRPVSSLPNTLATASRNGKRILTVDRGGLRFNVSLEEDGSVSCGPR